MHISDYSAGWDEAHEKLSEELCGPEAEDCPMYTGLNAFITPLIEDAQNRLWALLDAEAEEAEEA